MPQPPARGLTFDEEQALANQQPPLITPLQPIGTVADTNYNPNDLARRARDTYTKKMLKAGQEERRKALRSVDSVGLLAAAYGFKPEELPNDQRTNEALAEFSRLGLGSNVRPPDSFDAFTTALSRAMPFGGPDIPGVAQEAVSQGITDAVGTPGESNLKKLLARMREEATTYKTEGHPIASFSGALLGGAPTLAAFPATIPGAIAGGAMLNMLTPNTGTSGQVGDKIRKGVIGGIVGGVGAKVGQLAVSGGTKAVAASKEMIPDAVRDPIVVATRGRLRLRGIPEENLALQDLATSELGIPSKNLTAADISVSPFKDAYGNPTGQRVGPLVDQVNMARAAGSPRLQKIEAENIAAVNRRATNIKDEAFGEFQNTPFVTGENTLNGAAPTTAESIQASLPMEQANRQATIVTPAHDAIPPIPPPQKVDINPLVAEFENLVKEMRLSREGSEFTSPLSSVRGGEPGPSALNVVETQLKNLRGSRVEGGPSGGGLAYPGDAEPVVKSMRSAGMSDEQILSALHNYGYTKAYINKPAPTSTNGDAPWDTISDLMMLERNLANNRNAYKMTGTQTRPISQARSRTQEVIDENATSPAWQDFISKTKDARAKAEEFTIPYKNDEVQALLPGGAADTVKPDTALRKALSYDKGQKDLILGLLDPKGQAALRAEIIKKGMAGATNEGGPAGANMTIEGLKREIASLIDSGHLTPKQLADLTRLRSTLDVVATAGTTNPSVHALEGQGIEGLANTRSKLNFAQALISKAKLPIQTTNPGKAWYLTPSILDNPAKAGGLGTEMLRILQSKGPIVKSGVFNSRLNHTLVDEEQ